MGRKILQRSVIKTGGPSLGWNRRRQFSGAHRGPEPEVAARSSALCPERPSRALSQDRAKTTSGEGRNPAGQIDRYSVESIRWDRLEGPGTATREIAETFLSNPVIMTTGRSLDFRLFFVYTAYESDVPIEG
jgi:hypothetical protein